MEWKSKNYRVCLKMLTTFTGYSLHRVWHGIAQNKDSGSKQPLSSNTWKLSMDRRQAQAHLCIDWYYELSLQPPWVCFRLASPWAGFGSEVTPRSIMRVLQWGGSPCYVFDCLQGLPHSCDETTGQFNWITIEEHCCGEGSTFVTAKPVVTMSKINQQLNQL